MQSIGEWAGLAGRINISPARTFSSSPTFIPHHRTSPPHLYLTPFSPPRHHFHLYHRAILPPRIYSPCASSSSLSTLVPRSPTPRKLPLFAIFCTFFSPKTPIHKLFTLYLYLFIIFRPFFYISGTKKPPQRALCDGFFLFNFNDDGDDVRLRDCAQRGSSLLRTPRPRFQAPMSRVKYRVPSILHVFCA